MKDKSRQLPNTEMLATPDTTGALQDVLTSYWNKNQSADDAQKPSPALSKANKPW
jgi:glucose/mannose transport system substrate-binding protein